MEYLTNAIWNIRIEPQIVALLKTRKINWMQWYMAENSRTNLIQSKRKTYSWSYEMKTKRSKIWRFTQLLGLRMELNKLSEAIQEFQSIRFRLSNFIEGNQIMFDIVGH